MNGASIAQIGSLLLCLSFPIPCDAEAKDQFTGRFTGERVSIRHQDRDREYRIHLPESISEGEPVPLLIVLHGGGSNSALASVMGFSALADREKLIVVYPNAVNKHWNDGRDSPLFAEQDARVDDVSFILEIINQVSDRHMISQDQIFALGLSNGGFMTNRLAIEHSEIFAAVSVIIASMGEPMSKQFNPAEAVSIAYINGTKDPLMPYEGGAVGQAFYRKTFAKSEAPRGRAISTSKAAQLWVEKNKTDPDPIISTLPDRDKSDGSHIELTLWKNGTRGTAVAIYKVIGGGHHLPGGRAYLPKRFIGEVNQDASGVELAWDFFKNYARKAPGKK